MKKSKKNPQVVLAKTYGDREDKKENLQTKRTKILSSKAETKDVPPTDGARPDLKADYNKISTKKMAASPKKGARPSTAAVPGLTTNRQQKQRQQGMY